MSSAEDLTRHRGTCLFPRGCHPDARVIVIAHDQVADLDWPAMRTGFTAARDVALDPVGKRPPHGACLHRHRRA
ncbi:copper-binding protein [Rhodovulum kholense]|uniref:copper-binding protein n=1 Tax=Rhodovulum kholense TaxID=453584 RepID=UPI003CCBE325